MAPDPKKPYDDLSFTLSIVYCQSREKLVDIKVEKIYRNQNGRLVEYTEEQKNTLVVYDDNSLELKGHGNFRKRYQFPTNRVTIKRFVEAIVDFEKQNRPKSDWFGGIDCHHVFYEGLIATEDGAYIIFWGS
ncbi:hypothetical protein HA402_006684 [Bradysia odoriphaga]|nr:hypothetical protein HA402_006684 [Bradysia odoriphaga]